MTEARAMAAAKAVRISDNNNNDNNATTQQRDNADDAKDDTDAVEDGADEDEEDGGGHCRAADRQICRPALLLCLNNAVMALSGHDRASPPLRRQRRPLALEDQLVLRHGFVPANRPTLPPATTTTTTTALGPKSNEGWPAAGDTIIDDRWMAGNNKEGSGQEQTATIHCVLKAGERRPAERAAGNKKGKDKPTRRTSKEEEDYDNKEEEDCAAAAAAAATAAATPATTTGCGASSTATASDQAVAAVATARSSGLRQGVVAAAADSRMPLLTPVFSVSS